MNHPAGRIGKRLILRVCDIMRTGEQVPVCGPEELLMSILVDLSSKGCGCMLVVDKGTRRLMGTFTDGDLRRALNAKGGDVLHHRMGDLMNRTPRTIRPEEKAVVAMIKMETPSPVQFLPCVDDNLVVVGIVMLHALVSAGL